jgi:hypothetical protein
MKRVQQHFSLKITMLILLFTATACGSAAAPTPSFDAISTSAAQTLQAQVATSTPAPATVTALPTLISQPPTSLSTAIPQPPAPTTSNLPAATRINFATGTTESLTLGTISAGETLDYVIGALKNQPMIVMLTTPDDSAKLSIVGADGTVLLSPSKQLSNWQGYLPSTQDYYFHLTGNGSTQNFNLNVEIPARILFAAGQNEITLSGQTTSGFSVMYTAYARGGQQMDVTINTSPEVAALTIWGFSDGQPYARAQNGVTNFNMTLPSTQDYIIQVVPQGGNVVSYAVTVKIQ